MLAVLLTVLAPLGLLLWSALRGQEGIFCKLVTYWRVSSLLMITVYLLAAAIPIGFLTGVAARVLIPLSLGWPFGARAARGATSTSLYSAFHFWRQTLSLYCFAGVLFNLPLLRCTFTWQIGPLCSAWLSPVREFVGLVHPGVDLGLLGTFAWGALGIYLLAFTVLYARNLRSAQQT